jgi:hypothetical protein
MSTEVYLLSIPLARHRSIVPRQHRGEMVLANTAAHEPRHSVRGLTDSLLDSHIGTGTLQRFDAG